MNIWILMFTEPEKIYLKCSGQLFINISKLSKEWKTSTSQNFIWVLLCDRIRVTNLSWFAWDFLTFSTESFVSGNPQVLDKTGWLVTLVKIVSLNFRTQI